MCRNLRRWRVTSALITKHADERGDARASSSQVAPRHENELAPKRVRDALSGVDFGTFREKRAFSFLHLFSGPNDVLEKAVYAEAAKEGLTVDVTAEERALPQAPGPGAGGRVGRDPWSSSVRHLLEGEARTGSSAGKKQEGDLQIMRPGTSSRTKGLCWLPGPYGSWERSCSLREFRAVRTGRTGRCGSSRKCPEVETFHEGFRNQPGGLQHVRLPDEGEHSVAEARGLRGKAGRPGEAV